MEKSKKEAFPAMANVSELNASFQNNAKRIAAWYIDTIENLAKEGLSLREKTTSWAKDTPLAAIFEAQELDGAAVGGELRQLRPQYLSAR